jgi:hypothetical protein
VRRCPAAWLVVDSSCIRGDRPREIQTSKHDRRYCTGHGASKQCIRSKMTSSNDNQVYGFEESADPLARRNLGDSSTCQAEIVDLFGSSGRSNPREGLSS